MEENTNEVVKYSTKGILYSAGTDVGLRREENQDSYGIVSGPTWKLFIVADGMGGVQGGAVASRLVISTVEKNLKNAPNLTLEDVVAAIDEANAIIYQKGQSDEKLIGMGTTFVAFLYLGSELFVINVGDSRGYLIRNRQCQVLTEDHTLVQELLRSGAITPDQAAHHPVSHMLTRSIGPTESVDVDVYQFEDGPYANDKFLLCSDGLHNLVSEIELAEIVSKKSTDDAAQILIDLANERGGTDNITVIIVSCTDIYPPQPKAQDEKIEQSAVSSGREGYHEAGSVRSPDLTEINQFTEDYDDLPDEEILGISTSFSPFRYTALFGGFFGGLLVASIYYFTLSGNPNIDQEELNAARRNFKSVNKSEKAPSLASVLTELQGEPVPRDELGVSDESTLKNSIERRATELEGSIKNLSDRISSFGTESPSTVQAKLDAAMKKAEESKAKLSQVKSDLDLVTRKLSIWFGRLKRLDTTDAVNMASEVSASIPNVKQKKDEFERATWDYLKEVEALRYNPSDSEKEAKVARLVAVRTEKMKELTTAVRDGIEEMVSESDHSISELTVTRTKLESEVNILIGDIEYYRTILNGDEKQKADLLESLQKKREGAQVELGELQRLQ